MGAYSGASRGKRKFRIEYAKYDDGLKRNKCVDPFSGCAAFSGSVVNRKWNVLNIGIHHTIHIRPIFTLFKCTFLCHFLHSCFRLSPPIPLFLFECHFVRGKECVKKSGNLSDRIMWTKLLSKQMVWGTIDLSHQITKWKAWDVELGESGDVNLNTVAKAKSFCLPQDWSKALLKPRTLCLFERHCSRFCWKEIMWKQGMKTVTWLLHVFAVYRKVWNMVDLSLDFNLSVSETISRLMQL